MSQPATTSHFSTPSTGSPLRVSALLILLALPLALPLTGCVSKSRANEQARRAYIAGQQAAVARMQQQTQASGQPPAQVFEGDPAPQNFDPEALGLSMPDRPALSRVQPRNPSRLSPAQPQGRAPFSSLQPQEEPSETLPPLQFQDLNLAQPRTSPAQPAGQAQVVTVSGPVRSPFVVWHTGLTLGQALLNAGYTGAADPTVITITRNGRANPVDPQKLLAGQDVPLLPGDKVDVR